ncbi:MAG: hypothetical protein V7739_21995 [Motiliproteus sp.]
MNAPVFGFTLAALATAAGSMMLVTGSFFPLSIALAVIILLTGALCGWFFRQQLNMNLTQHRTQWEVEQHNIEPSGQAHRQPVRARLLQVPPTLNRITTTRSLTEDEINALTARFGDMTVLSRWWPP